MNTNIALGVRPPSQQAGPLDMYEGAVKLKDMLDVGKLREKQLTQADQEIEQNAENIQGLKITRQINEKKLSDDAAASEIIKKYLVKTTEDGDWEYDHDAVEGAMVRAGLNPMDYHKMRLDIEKASDEAILANLKTSAERSKKLGAAAQSILNATPELRSGLYSFTMKQLMSQKLITPEELKGIPQQYGGEKTDAMLQQLADMALENPYDNVIKRNEEKRKAKEAEKLAAETLKANIETESMLLGAAADEAGWANALAQLPEDRQAMYPKEFSEQARLQAATQGLSADQRTRLKQYNSVTELAQAAAQGDATAKAALDIIKKHEIAIDAGKEGNKAATGIGGMPLPNGTSPVGTMPEGARNEEILSKVNPAFADMVRGLVDGKRPYPSTMAQRDPFWKSVLEYAAAYEPGWDATRYKQRADTIKDFTSGQAARNVTSLNTVTGHLATLADAAKNLGNSGFTPYNTLKNWFANKTGDPKVKTFELARNAVADELERVFRGTGGSVTGIEEWKKTVGDADSPEQLQSVIKQAIELLGSRIEALRDQYTKGMGRQADFTFLTKKSRETLAKIVGEDFVKDIDPERDGSQVVIDGKTPMDTMTTVRTADGQIGKIPNENVQKFLSENKGSSIVDDPRK